MSDDQRGDCKGSCGDRSPGTGDDHVFETPSAVVEQLSQVYALTADEINQLNAVLGSVLVCRSDTFSFLSRARARSGRAESAVSCVVNRAGVILSWRQS